MEWKTKVGTYIKKITFNNNAIKWRTNKTIKIECYLFKTISQQNVKHKL